MGFAVTAGVFAAVGVLDGVIVAVVLAEMGFVVVVLVTAVVRGINLGVVLMDGPVGVVIVMVGVVVTVLGVVVFPMVVVGVVGVVDVAVLGVVVVVGVVDVMSVTVFADIIVVLIVFPVFPVMGDVARTAIGFPTVVVVLVAGVPAELVVGDFPGDGVATFCSEPESRKYQQIKLSL